MKVLVVPDIHGSWSQALAFIRDNKDSVDKVVTLGDYVDDWEEHLNGKPMQEGFLQLIDMARAEPNKFCICLGNHDHAYISSQTCSGHHFEYAEMYSEMFKQNMDIIYPAVLIDGVLFSHAGVSQHWYSRTIAWYNDKHKMDKVPNELKCEYNKWKYNYNNIEEVFFDGVIRSLVNPKTKEDEDYIKEYHEKQAYAKKMMDNAYAAMEPYFKDTFSSTFKVETLKAILDEDTEYFCHCGYSSSGDSPGESCIWIRPSSLLQDNWPGHLKCQVVGHTELGLKKFKYRTHKLIVCDNHKHDCGFILDTENIGDDFEKVKYEKNPYYNMRSNESLLRLLLGGAI